MKNKILIINIGWEQEPLIERLFLMGFEVFAVHYNDNYNKQYPFSKVLISDLRDLEKILEFALEIQPQAVISDECDYSNFAQAIVANTLGLPGPKIEQAQISANKYLQRLKAQSAGVLVPAFKLASNINDLNAFIAEYGFPVIIKPIDNRGSFGVTKVNDENGLQGAFISALVNSFSRLVLIEKFIEGYEITVDGYCFEGTPHTLSVAKKSKEGLNIQVSMDIKYPGDIPVEVYNTAVKNNEYVTSALGYDFGMTHSEYIIDNQNDIYLVESANRGGGVYTSEIIVPTVSGIDVLGAYINDCTQGSGKVHFVSPQQNSVILKFFSFSPGRIKAIKGIEELTRTKGVLKFRLAVNVGDEILPIKNDGNRHGFIIYTTTGDLRSEVKDIIEKIQVEYL